MAEITIGAMARRTGLAVSAIRYYESQSLIAPNRNAGGQRRYPKSDIRRLSFVIIAQKLGFTLTQIREVLTRLPEARTPTEADWERIAKAFRADLDAKIDTLTRLRDDFGGCIGCGCLSMKRCALFNPADQAAAKGPGPRYLLGDRPET
ncbi:MAG: redox-sensitive transcriptional activator SoxR [Rhodobacteraceae bacterium]|nr:redox-sensitive transcriptional activator SoxR [Paracoccaceae bacterium]